MPKLKSNKRQAMPSQNFRWFACFLQALPEEHLLPTGNLKTNIQNYLCWRGQLITLAIRCSHFDLNGRTILRRTAWHIMLRGNANLKKVEEKVFFPFFTYKLNFWKLRSRYVKFTLQSMNGGLRGLHTWPSGFMQLSWSCGSQATVVSS